MVCEGPGLGGIQLHYVSYQSGRAGENELHYVSYQSGSISNASVCVHLCRGVCTIVSGIDNAAAAAGELPSCGLEQVARHAARPGRGE